MIRVIKLLGSLAFVIGVMAACSGGDEPTVPPPTPGNTAAASTPPTALPDAQPALPLNEAGAQLVARVNGIEITLPVFERTLYRTQTVTDAAGYDAAVAIVLNMLIEQALINQQAQSMGILVSDEEVEAQYQEMRAMIPEDAAWQQWLEDNWFTEAEFWDSLRSTLLTQRVQAQVIDAGNLMIPVIHARHILVGDLETAAMVMARLDAGEDFAQLAAQYSTDITTRNSGGDLGWFAPNDFDMTAPELAQFALQLPLGQRGGPVSTMLGYHIVETLEVGQRPATPEEQFDAGVAQFTLWLQSLRADALIERYIQ